MVLFGNQIRREAVEAILRKTYENIGKIEKGGGVGRGAKRDEFKMKPYIFVKYSTTVRPNHSQNFSLILARKERYLYALCMQVKHCFQSPRKKKKHCFQRAGHKEKSLLVELVSSCFKTTGCVLQLSPNAICLLSIVKYKVERFHV